MAGDLGYLNEAKVVKLSKGDELLQLADRIKSLSVDTSKLVRERLDRLIILSPETAVKEPEDVLETWPTYLNELRNELFIIEKYLSNIKATIYSVEL